MIYCSFCRSEPPYSFRAPPEYNTFVLVDDSGALLAKGSPTGELPHISERAMNYRVVYGSKYAVEADKIAAQQNHAM